MGEGKGITTVTHDNLRAWMEAGRDCVVIDILPGDVYRKRPRPGAKNACVYEVVFPHVKQILQSYGILMMRREVRQGLERMLRISPEGSEEDVLTREIPRRDLDVA